MPGKNKAGRGGLGTEHQKILYALPGAGVQDERTLRNDRNVRVPRTVYL